MLRAFLSLSRTLSLTKTCQELGATRQTVRRHITDLETIVGQKFFCIHDRQYQLTDDGHAALDGAKDILRKLDVWSGASDLKKLVTDGLERIIYTDNEGRTYHSQQHPISRITNDGLPIMRHALSAWGAATAAIEHEAMEKIRPYTVLFRKGPAGWVFVDIGKESAYSKWFGWAWSKSAIGKLINEDNAGDDYSDFISGSYVRIYNEGGVRLDDILAYLPNTDLEPTAVTYQRLLLGCSFPDGTPGMIVLVAATKNVIIDSADPEILRNVSNGMSMDDIFRIPNQS